jgi:hypothetical protein
MTKTGTVIMVVMVDGVIMMDGVIEVAAVDGGRVPILASMLDRLTPPTDTTADTRTEDCPGDTPMEGGGWAPINPAAAPNTYTGKGGTRR